MSENSEVLKVDIRKIIGSKNPKLLKRLPSFLLNWLERFIHQDLINETLEAGKEKEGIEFIDVIFNKFDINVNSINLENIPQSGGCIIAANHPLGGLDGLALMYAVSKVRKDFLFLANDILLNIKPLESCFLPVNRVGITDRKSLQLISDAYSSGKCILIFPSGFVSRKIKGKIQDLPWQKSLITKARTHNLPIVPTFIDGQNSKRFYRIARLREIFKIKVNFEMMTLPDEMFKQQGNTITITFSPAVESTHFSKGNAVKIAQTFKDFIYSLKKDKSARY